MLDHLIGILLLGLGINSPYNPNVKGDETVATQSALLPGKVRSFRLNPLEFETPRSNHTSTSATRRNTFDSHAFGMGILKMQREFDDGVEASKAAALQYYQIYKTAFQQKIVSIKDTRKQALVDKLNTNCQNINTQRTDKMTTMLGKLSQILVNVTNREASAAASGKDTSGVDTAVTAAQAAIADAQAAVTAQAGVNCTITITSTASATLKADVGKTVSGLTASLQVVYAKVVAAKKAVGDAIRALALLTGESLEQVTPKPTTASSSATR